MPRQSQVMPAPAALVFTAGRLQVTGAFTVAATGHGDGRLQRAVARLLKRWEGRMGIVFSNAGWVAPDSAALVIDCPVAGRGTPVLGEDESYTLTVDSAGARLRAGTTVGALPGD